MAAAPTMSTFATVKITVYSNGVSTPINSSNLPVFHQFGANSFTLNIGDSIQTLDYSNVGIKIDCDEIPPIQKGDINEDGCIDMADIFQCLHKFGVETKSPADVNGDGKVNLADVLEIIQIISDNN